MKKFVSIVLMATMVLSMLAGHSAAEWKDFDLVQIGSLTAIKKGCEVSYKNADGKHIAYDYKYIDDEEFNTIVDFFSDDNLTSIIVENMDESSESAYPSGGYIFFCVGDDDYWEIYFDNDRVRAFHINSITEEMYSGWFTYKDEAYDRLIEYLDKMYERIKPLQDKEWEEYQNEQEKYKTQISDISFIYKATVPSNITRNDILEWGVCSYVKDGESEPTIAVYAIYVDTRDNITTRPSTIFICEEKPENNKVFFSRNKLMHYYDNGRISYIRTNASATWLYDLEIDVNEEMKVAGLTIGSSIGNKRVVEEADMRQYKEEGTLPEGLFVPNVKTEEEEPKETAKPDATAAPKATAEPKPTQDPEDKTKEEQKEPTQTTPAPKQEENNVVTDDKFILTIGKTTANVFGKNKENDVAPIIRSDRTMLPARFVAENLGAEVEWIEAERKVKITKGNIEILIYINSETTYVNGWSKTLDSPAFIENDRTYTPVRFVAEELGAIVDWNEADNEVIIMRK